MILAIGCDHGALELKNTLVAYLQQKGHTVRDFGCYSTDSCDYPDFAAAAARAVANGECEKGIVLCTTGIGVSICANKIRGIRCALLSDETSARLTREHNDANMMAMGAATVTPELAQRLTDIFLSIPFSQGERHIRRIQKVMALED